jgi:hypothetical protein
MSVANQFARHQHSAGPISSAINAIDVCAGATALPLLYDSSRYLLTSVDLPTVTRVVEARGESPRLAVALKLDISIVREFVGREEFLMLDVPADSPAISTAQVNAEFLIAWCRLLDLLANLQDIPFLSGFIEREIMYRILRGPEGARLRAIATLGDQSHSTAKAIAWIKANYAQPLRVEELAQIAGWRSLLCIKGSGDERCRRSLYGWRVIRPQ